MKKTLGSQIYKLFNTKNNKLGGCDKTKGAWAGGSKLWDSD